MSKFKELLERSATLHQHLCPRQVLGVRMSLLGGKCLGLNVPQQDKRLLTVVETDGCATDGIAVAAGCYVGRRTMRVLDFGKVAATFIDTHTGRAVRVVPSSLSRTQAKAYAPQANSRWEAYLLGYQRMPDEELLDVQDVEITFSLEKLLSKDGYRVNCEICGEEIINEREVVHEGLTMCRACAGGRYYRPVEVPSACAVTLNEAGWFI